jgi:hypothetical protein
MGFVPTGLDKGSLAPMARLFRKKAPLSIISTARWLILPGGVSISSRSLSALRNRRVPERSALKSRKTISTDGASLDVISATLKLGP